MRFNRVVILLVSFAIVFDSININASGISRFQATSKFISAHYSLDTVPVPETIGGKVYGKVDSEAVYPGGEREWLNFLVKNLDGDVPAKRGAPSGSYTVIMQFVINEEGYISQIKPLTKFGYGMEEEVIRILNLSSQWKPASLNGRAVIAYRKQPVTFMVQVGKKKRP